MSLQINCLACHILAKHPSLSTTRKPLSLQSTKNNKGVKKDHQSLSLTNEKASKRSDSKIIALKKIA